MTAPTTTPDAKPARKPAAKKTIAKKASPKAKPEFAPVVKVSDDGKTRLDHTECGHPRTFAGREACRKAQRTADAA